MRYSSRHSARTPERRVRAGLVATVTTGLALAFAAAPSPAGAVSAEELLGSKDLVLIVDDGYSKGRCAFGVKNVDYTTGTIRDRLNSSVSAKSFSTAQRVAHVAVACAVYDANLNLVHYVFRDADGAYILRQTKNAVLPYSSNYYLCTQVVTTTKTGDTFFASNCVA